MHESARLYKHNKSKLTGERSETYPHHQYLSVSSHSLLELCTRK